MGCKVGSVSLESKVWSVKCRVQRAQCGGKLKGPPSALEWTFGSVARSNAVSGQSSGRQVDVRRQHDNGARPKFHALSSVKWTKLWVYKTKKLS